MSDHPLILKLDQQGTPRSWITYEQAAYYYSKDLIEWSIGEEGYTIFGGRSRMTGERSYMYFDPIVAIKGKKVAPNFEPVKVSKKTLFRRDHFICAYCGNNFADIYREGERTLQMEHVKPLSHGGPSTWENLVTACRSCNTRKADRTPEQANMQLLYVPYAPVRSEYLILTNRKVLFDQMEYLKARVPAHSRVHQH